MIEPAGSNLIVRPEGRLGCGIVVAIGPMCYVGYGDRKLLQSLQIGQRVLFPKYNGVEVHVNGELLLVLDAKVIEGVVGSGDIVGCDEV